MIVYTSTTGQCYHKRRSHLRGPAIKWTMVSALERLGYRPCKVCVGDTK